MDLASDSACHSPVVQCWNCATGIPEGVALCPGCGLPPRGRPAPGTEPPPQVPAAAPRDPHAPLFGRPSPAAPTPEVPAAVPELSAPAPERPAPAPDAGGPYLFGPGPSAPATDRPLFSPATP